MNKKCICRYNKFGYCKFVDKCHFRHNNTICVEKNCNISECEKRHPKICIYKRDYGRCKFTPCAYSHEKAKATAVNSDKIDKLEKKVEDIEKRSVNKNIEKNIENKLIKKLEAMEIEFENKIKSFENRIKDLSNKIEEKDIVIKKLECKVIEIETKQLETLNDTKMENEILIEKVETLIEKETLKCNLCAFTTTSKSGLKIHKKRKHTNYDNFPMSCELCEMKINSSFEMKNHLKTHSCKLIQYKCSFCDYLAEDDMGIEAHVRKTHEGNSECCLCEFAAENSESLDIHLRTCEVYKCNKCEKVSKTITEFKQHCEKEHEHEKYISVCHIKQNRDNSEAFDSKFYTCHELFKQK